MAYINIAFDSGQVAGWEQMLGAGRGSGLNRGGRGERGEKKSFSKVLHNGSVQGNGRRLADAGNQKAFRLSKQLACEFINHSLISLFSNSSACLSLVQEKSIPDLFLLSLLSESAEIQRVKEITPL